MISVPQEQRPDDCATGDHDHGIPETGVNIPPPRDERGITGMGTNGQHEISADLVIKKPFRLASRVELMAGLGPELSWALTHGSHARTLATECALDLMIWLGLTGGLLIGLPWLRQ